MSYRNLNVPAFEPEEADDECTESTQKLVRHPSGYYFDVVLDIVQVHTKQNLE